MEEIKRFIESKKYKILVNEICKSVKIKIEPVYDDVLCNLDYVKLEKASITISDLEEILEKDHTELVIFSISKLMKYHGVKMQQEYPKGEEPDEEDRDNNIVHKGYSQGFLLLYAIEYFLLKYKPDTLDNYLKLNRIPQAKKYVKELRTLYEKSQKNRQE